MDRYRLKAKNRPPPTDAPIMVHRTLACITNASKKEPSHGAEARVAYSGCGTSPEGSAPVGGIPEKGYGTVIGFAMPAACALDVPPDAIPAPKSSASAFPPCVKFRLKKPDTSSTAE